MLHLGEHTLHSTPLSHPAACWRLQLHFPRHQLGTEPWFPLSALQSLEATPFSYVDTPAALRAAAARLASAREVAVDLEAHSFRSYQVTFADDYIILLDADESVCS
jgi:exosome complex exonuclease RRP6